jgi:hypothetical protein
MCILTIINSAVNGDGPHARRVSIAVTIIIFTTVTTRPDVDIPQTIAALNKTDSLL